MALEKCLFMFRLIVYCCLWGLSLCCWIPICIVVDNHEGYCLLYTDGKEYGPLAVCGYTISVPIIFSLLYPSYMVVSYFFKISFFNRYGYIEETLTEFVITVIVDGLSWIFMFVNASMISSGFNQMCWALFSTIEKCSEGYLQQPAFGTDYFFYQNIKTAEVSAWLSWLLWLMQLTSGIVVLQRSQMLPIDNSPLAALCRLLPCRPRCNCSCDLQFNHPQQQQQQRVKQQLQQQQQRQQLAVTGAAPVSAESSPPRRTPTVAVTNV